LELLLGIDVGTTNCKAAVFSIKGELISFASTKTPLRGAKSSEYSYFPQEMWETICQIIRQVLSQIPPGGQVKAMAIASMAEAGVLLDKAGVPLYPFVPYFDQRAMPQCELLEKRIGRDKIFSITGLHVNPVFSLPKILWIKANEPKLFSRSVKWLCIPDFINYRLTGRIATDFSIASRTLALELKGSCWSGEILDAVDINPELFPPLFPGGTVIGEVTSEAAGQTGLQKGMPVVSGGHDHYCGSVAAGLMKGGRIINSIGTAESIHTLLPQEFSPADELKGFQFGKYLRPDYTYIDAGLSSSGLVVEWSMRRFASIGDWGENAQEGASSPSYDTICRRLMETTPSSQSLLFIPHLRGGGYPDWNPRSCGALIGLRSSHTSLDIFRAVFEGLCFETRKVLGAMIGIVGEKIAQINGIGGGTRNEFWMQTKADVTGFPIEVPDVEESTVLGAALLAGMGVSIYKDMVDASENTYRVNKRYEPRVQFQEKYESLFQIYNHILDSNLAEIHRDLYQLGS